MMFKRGGKRFPSKLSHRLIFSWKRARQGGGSSYQILGYSKQLIPTPSEAARGSRNQGVIGGVVFYSEIINERADVICSVMTERVCLRTGCSDPLISITKNLNYNKVRGNIP